MAKKIITTKTETLFDETRQGCFAPRPLTPEVLDPEPICDIVANQPDTLASALERINRGSMSYEEFQTLHGGEFDFESDDDIPGDFDENDFYIEENDNGKYFDKDRESKILKREDQQNAILAAKSENSSQNDGQSAQNPVDPELDKGNEA